MKLRPPTKPEREDFRRFIRESLGGLQSFEKGEHCTFTGPACKPFRLSGEHVVLKKVF